MYVEAHEMVTEYLVRNAFERLHTLEAKGVDFMKPRIKRDFIVGTDCMKVGAGTLFLHSHFLSYIM